MIEFYYDFWSFIYTHKGKWAVRIANVGLGVSWEYYRLCRRYETR